MRPFFQRRGPAVMLGLIALTSACSAGSSATGGSSAPANSSPATTARTVTAGQGGGTVAGKPFVTTSQFVQFDQMVNMWRLHILDGAHSCADDLASIRPAVGIDFIQPADAAATPPRIGTTTDGLGVVFVPADRNTTFGPLTTTSGVTLTIDHDGLDVGQHWTGHLRVAGFQQDGLSYAYDGALDAEVCPAVTA